MGMVCMYVGEGERDPMGRVRGGVVGVVEGVEGLGRDVLSAVVRYGDAECDGRRQTRRGFKR